MNLVVRKATQNDIEAIQEISKITWADTYTFLPNGQMEFMLDWMYSSSSLLKQMNNGHQFFVAEYENKIVGFASTSLQELNIYKLNKLYVLPIIQKIGAGKALLKRVVAFAKENSAKEIQLQVNRNNNAKDFYLKQGFVVLYEADFEIGNGYFMNDYVMSLTLS